MKKYLLLATIILSLSLSSAVVMSNGTIIQSHDSGYKITPNTTINFTKMVMDTELEIYNLSGGGNLSNIGDSETYIKFFDLVPYYNNVRWNYLTIESTNLDNFLVRIAPNELIEVFYKLSETTTPTEVTRVVVGGKNVFENKRLYIVIGVLILLIIIIMIAFLEYRDRTKNK